MRILIDKIDDFSSLSAIKLFLTGLLFISLVACEKQEPETISSELNLHVSAIGNDQFLSEETEESNDQIDSNVIEEKTIKANDQLIEDVPQYLSTPIALKTKNRNVFAQDGLTTPFMEDEFYLLGWSADGEKIAYAIQRETDAAALFSAGIYIQDLVTDKIVWGMKKETELEELNNIKDYWVKNKQAISQGMSQHHIILGDHSVLKNTPIIYNNDQFDYSVKTTKANIGNELKAYRVLLNSKLKGSKEIAKVTLQVKGDQLGGKEKVAVLGYFQGADEARVATLVALLESGWEGSRIVRYKIIGASLKYGKWHK